MALAVTGGARITTLHSRNSYATGWLGREQGEAGTGGWPPCLGTGQEAGRDLFASASSRTMWGTLRARVHSGYVWGYDVALQVSVPPEVRNSPKQITASPPIQQHYCTSPPYSGIAANLP